MTENEKQTLKRVWQMGSDTGIDLDLSGPTAGRYGLVANGQNILGSACTLEEINLILSGMEWLRDANDQGRLDW